jgi:hypothetical protein
MRMRNAKVLLGSLLLLLFSLSAQAATPKLKNEQYANKKDLELTKTFLSDLPPACSRTNARISKSGTIIIKTLCDGNGSTPGMDGEIRIKNGKVTTLR